MKLYSVGLYFSADGKKVALIRKAKPDWQKGKLNGVGGHVEDRETFAQCMTREFQEETGIETFEFNWTLMVEQRGVDYILAVFKAHHQNTDLPTFKSANNEPVEWYDVATLCARTDVIPNIKWFTWLAFDKVVQLPLQVQTP